jgi:hypothetical protein
MKGFKVLFQKPSGTLTSPWAPKPVRYLKGKWNHPRKGCGPLSVLDNFQRALVYCCQKPRNPFSKEGLVVWECDYIPFTDPLPAVVPDLPKKLWQGEHYLCFLPSEVVLAKKVRLLRKVFP